MPSYDSYIVSKPLSRRLMGYKNGEFIADQLATIIPVDEEKGFYYIYGREVFTPEDDYLADRARANAVDHEFTQADYRVHDHALNHDVSWKQRDAAARNNHPVRPYQRAVTVIGQKLALGREIAIANMVRSTTNVAQNVTLSGTSQWNDYSGTSNPMTNIATGRNEIREAVGALPNLAVIPYAVWEKLRFHPTLINLMAITGLRRLTREIVAELFDVERIIVPTSIYNTANPGQAFASADVWGKDVILARVVPGELNFEVTLMNIFRMRMQGAGVDVDTGENVTAQVRRWQEVDRSTDVVEGKYAEDRRFIAPDAAFLIKNAVA